VNVADIRKRAMPIRHLALAEKEIREYLSDLDPFNKRVQGWRELAIKTKLKDAMKLIAEAKFLRDQMELHRDQLTPVPDQSQDTVLLGPMDQRP
jgi:hypothetical protein